MGHCYIVGCTIMNHDDVIRSLYLRVDDGRTYNLYMMPCVSNSQAIANMVKYSTVYCNIIVTFLKTRWHTIHASYKIVDNVRMFTSLTLFLCVKGGRTC